MNTNTTNRKKTRKLLFQFLFASCFQKTEKEAFLESFYKDTFSFELDLDYMDEMINIIEFIEWFFIDIVKKYSPKFDFEKMDVLIIIPLYIALAEIFYFSEEIPIKVSVNEAVELAKTFAMWTSKKIVNWVLWNVFRDLDELEKIKENYKWNDWYSIFKKS